MKRLACKREAIHEWLRERLGIEMRVTLKNTHVHQEKEGVKMKRFISHITVVALALGSLAAFGVTTLLALFATEASSLTEGVFLSFLLRVSFHDFALDLSKMFVKIPALLLYWAETEPLKKLNDS